MTIGSLTTFMSNLETMKGGVLFRYPSKAIKRGLEAEQSDERSRDDDERMEPVDRQTYERLLRGESFVTRMDTRTDVSQSATHLVSGHEGIDVDEVRTTVEGHITERCAQRARTTASYESTNDGEALSLLGAVAETTVEGRTVWRTAYAAEVMVGGAFTHLVTGAYARIAAWTDLLAWGGWAEIDVVRTNIAGLMIRSQIGVAHASALRVVKASRIIDDLMIRTENFLLSNTSKSTVISAGGPGSGIENAV